MKEESNLKKDLPLLFDDKTYLDYASKRYGKRFINWVQKNWITATEREVECMFRGWRGRKD